MENKEVKSNSFKIEQMGKIKELCSDLADLAFWIEKKREQNCTKIVVSSVLNMRV